VALPPHGPMKAALWHSNRDVRIVEMPVPEIGPGEVLMRVRASGLCGSDVMEWYRKPKAPLVLGHEVAGEVAAVGAGVTAFAAGDRIVATHHVPCGGCRYCLAGHESVCDTLRTTRFEPGGFAEYVRLPRMNVEKGTLRLPEEVSFEEGSFVEPLGCVVRGQRLARIEPGRSVLILGSGLTGLLHLMLARARGAGPVVVTDVDPRRLEAARRLGADAALRAAGRCCSSLPSTRGRGSPSPSRSCGGRRSPSSAPTPPAPPSSRRRSS
jgi:L-iditol 2-dehydrogenase